MTSTQSVNNSPTTNLITISPLKAHHQSILLMGCHFVLTAVDVDPSKAWHAIRKGVREIQRIERLISSWTLSSETTKINENAGKIPVKVSQELWDLIERCQRISRLTSGAFDISGTLSRDYWAFNNLENKWLSEQNIHKLRSLVDYRNIRLCKDDCTVYLAKEGMKIGFGAIGKGYAAYKAYKVMKSCGVQSGLVNASGDLMCWGKPPNEDHWSINIPNPEKRKEPFLKIDIPFGSVVTSGNYEKYTLYEGKRYAHIIDPRTGLPVCGIKNVSVICPNPELGDALATAITVMGVDEGLSIINKLRDVECVIIDADNIKYYSNNLRI